MPSLPPGVLWVQGEGGGGEEEGAGEEAPLLPLLQLGDHGKGRGLGGACRQGGRRPGAGLHFLLLSLHLLFLLLFLPLFLLLFLLFLSLLLLLILLLFLLLLVLILLLLKILC